MANPPATIRDVAASRFDGEAILVLTRLVRLIRARKKYVLGTLAVFCALGALYYLRATRIYSASTSVMVTRTSPAAWNATTSDRWALSEFDLTYERLFAKDVVLESALRKIRKLPAELKVDFESESADKWAEILRTNLDAKSIKRTNLIELSYRSKRPEAAEAIVRSIVDAYIEFLEEQHKDVSAEIVALLDEERKQIEEQLINKQQEVLAAQQRVGDLDLPEGSRAIHPVVHRVVQLNEALVDAQKKRLQLEATLAALNNTASSNRDALWHHFASVEPTVGRELMMGTLGLSPQLIDDVGDLQRKLAEDRAKLESWKEHLGPRHPEILKLRRSLQHSEEYLANYQNSLSRHFLESQDGELRPVLMAMVKHRLAESKFHERELYSLYAAAEHEAISMNDRAAQLQIAKSELDRLRRLHEIMLDRISDVDINQNHANVRVAVVSDPKALDRPVSPRLLPIAGFCIGFSLCIGIGLAYVVDFLDDRFRSPEEIDEQLGISVLTMVPSLDDSQQVGANAIQVHSDPASVQSEAFRTLRTALALSGEETERVAVTSTQPGDGKTTVLANLAAAYAQAGKRTLAIDADLRRPGLSRLLGLRSLTGLSSLLRGTEPIDGIGREHVQTTEIENLHVLPAGPKPSDPAELLSSDRMAQVIAWAEANYDQILVDCPPVFAASDAAILGRAVDGMIFVVKPHENHRRAVHRAVSSLTAMRVKLIGVVANSIFEKDSSAYGYGYGFGYGHNAAYGYRHDEDDVSDPPAADIVPRRAA